MSQTQTIPIQLPQQSQNAQVVDLPQQVQDENTITSQNIFEAENYIEALKYRRTKDNQRPTIDDLSNAIEYKHKVVSKKVQNVNIPPWANTILQQNQLILQQIQDLSDGITDLQNIILINEERQELIEARSLDKMKNFRINFDDDKISPLVDSNFEYPTDDTCPSFPQTKGDLKSLGTNALNSILNFYELNYQNRNLNQKRKLLANFLGFDL